MICAVFVLLFLHYVVSRPTGAQQCNVPATQGQSSGSSVVHCTNAAVLSAELTGMVTRGFQASYSGNQAGSFVVFCC
jgi:hypothetical protein